MNNINMTVTEKLLTRKEAAEYLGVKEKTLAVWACTKRYELSYIKVGKSVRYRFSDILKFIESRLVEGV